MQSFKKFHWMFQTLGNTSWSNHLTSFCLNKRQILQAKTESSAVKTRQRQSHRTQKGSSLESRGLQEQPWGPRTFIHRKKLPGVCGWLPACLTVQVLARPKPKALCLKKTIWNVVGSSCSVSKPRRKNKKTNPEVHAFAVVIRTCKISRFSPPSRLSCLPHVMEAQFWYLWEFTLAKPATEFAAPPTRTHQSTVYRMQDLAYRSAVPQFTLALDSDVVK